MGKARTQSSSAKLLRHVVSTVQAVGTMTLLVTPHNKIVYCSPIMSSWGLTIGKKLSQPDLRAVANQAWATREHIVQACRIETPSQALDVVVQAGIVERRWALLSVMDRTQEVRSTQIRRDFVSNVGHELRTPVTSVALLAEALRTGADDPAAVRHFADRLESVAERLARLTEGMLDLARTESGQEFVRLERVHVGAVIDRAMELSRETALERDITLRVKNKADAIVMGDKDALVTVMANLLSNAIHYSSPGGQVVVALRTDQAENSAAIHVIDHGIGIAEADKDRVFERFYRTDEARSHRAGGSGIGLAIVKHLVMAHGGTVTVESQMSSGSTFTVTLPLVEDGGPLEGTGATIRSDREEKG